MGLRVKMVSNGPRNQSGSALSKMTTLGVVLPGLGWMDTRYASRSSTKFVSMMFIGGLLMVTRVTLPVVWNLSVPCRAGAGGVTAAKTGAASSRTLKEARMCLVENRMVLLLGRIEVSLGGGNDAQIDVSEVF